MTPASAALIWAGSAPLGLANVRLLAASEDSVDGTLLLLPVYATFYRDDEGQPQRVLINGQTGQLSGVRRGSMKRAQRTSLVIGIVALVLFLLSVGAAVLGAMVPPALAIGVVGAVMAVLIGIGAIIPIARVWSFNRRESRATPEV